MKPNLGIKPALGLTMVMLMAFFGSGCPETPEVPEIPSKPESTATPASPPKTGGQPLSAKELVKKANTPSGAIIAHRVAKKGAVIRNGPSAKAAKEDSLVAGENVFVLEEKDGWLRFRPTKGDVGWSGWVKKSDTSPK